jgi:CheY-like chemotaxis protein
VVTRSPRVVFVIDSNEDTRVTHETILRNEGYDILSAPDGARALTLLREQRPDLLLLGSKIGTMTVSKLIQVLRSDGTLNETRILVHAAGLDETMSEAMLAGGANGVIRRPAPPQELVREVVRLIGRA